MDGIVVMQGTLSGGGSRLITSADVTDGASNTIMVGEKRMDSVYYVMPAGGGGEPDDDAGYVGGFQDDVVRVGALGGATPKDPYQPLPPQPDITSRETSAAAAQYYGYQFGSAHPGGAQVVFCDGSVHLIHYTVDAEVFRRLSSRNDGQTVNAGDN